MSSQRVLAIDPGSYNLGWIVVESQGNSIVYIDGGVLSFSTKLEFPYKLGKIFQFVQEMASKYKVSCLSLEKSFVGLNKSSALCLGEVRGAVIAAVSCLDIKVYQYAATKIKIATTGSGKATKIDVSVMVNKIIENLPQEKLTEYDFTDAAAIAVCHISHSSYNQLIQRSLQ